MREKHKAALLLLSELIAAALLLAADLPDNAGPTSQELLEGLALARLSALRLSSEQRERRKHRLR
jgi:hypothetical protein